MNRALRQYLNDLISVDWGDWKPIGEVPYTFMHNGREYDCVQQAKNRLFTVQVTKEDTEEFGFVSHLWIMRNDREALLLWEVVQEIKNTFVGEDRVAIEVYPSEEDHVIEPKLMRHLYVLPEGASLSFGLHREFKRGYR